MKKVLILFISVFVALSFTGCEADAKASDFLSPDDIAGLLGEEFVIEPDIGVLNPPLPIIEINEVTFIATQQIAFLTQNGLSIFFINAEGDEIKLSIANPATETYTAQSTSTSLFVAEYTVGGKTYTTLPADAPGSDGALGLILNGDSVSSEFFRFNAFVKNTTDEVEGISGDFEDVIIIDQR